MRRFAFIMAALLGGACVDEPTQPNLGAPEFIAPQLQVYVARSGGTMEIPPRPGANDVAVQGVNGVGQAVGGSGGRAVIWELTGPPEDPVVVRELPQLVGALEIDDAGRVLGHRDDRAAILEGSQVTLIAPLPGHDRTAPGGLSNGGHVVGSSWTGDVEENSRGFIWQGGIATMLPPLQGHQSSQALAVNRAGTAVGVSYNASTERRTIVVWEDATPISTGFEIPDHLVHGISDAGDVLISTDSGDRVVLWRDGIATTLPPPDGARPHWALDISPNGKVLGRVASDDGSDRYGLWNGADFITVSTSPVASCWRVSDGGLIVCDSPARTYPFYTSVGGTRLGARAVSDLTPTNASGSTVTLTWTQVADDRGDPARYRVKYSRPPLSWGSATIGCDRTGDEIGAALSCTVQGLAPSTSYDFQLMSYRRTETGGWAGAVYSNIGVGETTAGGGDPEPPTFEVGDLRVTDAGDSFLTMTWTQVDDGSGEPASYRLKWSTPPIDYSNANVAVRCGRWIRGDQIGVEMSCIVDGLNPSTSYELQLMSFRMENGAWINARHSNIARSTTAEGG